MCEILEILKHAKSFLKHHSICTATC